MMDKVYRPNWRPEWREKYGDYQQYAKVYKDAARVLLAHLENSGYDHDYQILPLIFLFRHYIELELKGLILFCYTVSLDIEDIDDVIKKAREKHRLFELLTYLENIKIRYIEISVSDELKDFVKKFDDLDPRAIRFRYPETNKGALFYENDSDYDKDEPFFKDLMDLKKISINIKMVMSELHKISTYLNGEKDTLFETVQGEQDHENY